MASLAAGCELLQDRVPLMDQNRMSAQRWHSHSGPPPTLLRCMWRSQHTVFVSGKYSALTSKSQDGRGWGCTRPMATPQVSSGSGGALLRGDALHSRKQFQETVGLVPTEALPGSSTIRLTGHLLPPDPAASQLQPTVKYFKRGHHTSRPA